MIVLKARHYREIISHSVNALPNEACGLLGGRIEDGIKHVEKVYLLTNLDDSPEHFTMDPREQFAAVKDMRSNGWELLGNFHSHPATPARPSEEDKRLAFDPGASYLILSLLNMEVPVLKSFRIIGGWVIEEELRVVEEENKYPGRKA